MPEVSIPRPDAAPAVDRLVLREHAVRVTLGTSYTCCPGMACFESEASPSGMTCIGFSCFAEDVAPATFLCGCCGCFDVE